MDIPVLVSIYPDRVEMIPNVSFAFMDFLKTDTMRMGIPSLSWNYSNGE